MKEIFSTFLLLVLVITSNAQSINATDDAQIRELVKTMETGWAKKDGTLFAKPFAENADYVIINGSYIKGKKAIAEGHQAIFDSFYKETFITTQVQSLRPIAKDVVIVHFTSHLTGNSAGQKIDAKGQISLTVLKSADKWQIESFQNTPTAQ